MARIPGTKKKEEEKTSSIFNVPPRLPAPAPTPEPAPVPGGEERSDEPIKTGQELLGESEVGKKDVELLGKGGIRIRGQEFFGPGLAPEFQQAAAREISGADPSVQQQRVGELRESIIGEQERATGIIEEQGGFATSPTAAGIDISAAELAGQRFNVPIIGGIGRAATLALEELFSKDERTDMIASMTPEQQAETVRQRMLREIREETVKEGLSASEEFGGLLEGIPFVSGEVKSYLGTNLDLPSENAKTVQQTVARMKEDYTKVGERVRSGTLDPMTAFKDIDQMDRDVAQYEGQLKVMISISQELQVNTQLVDAWRKEILRVQKESFYARQDAERALINQPIPTDAALVETFRDLKQ